MLSHPWDYTFLHDSPSLPVRDSVRDPTNNRMYYFFISTLLTQLAGHKGPSPPAAKGLCLNHKYNIMGVNSLLMGYKPNPEGSWGLCDRPLAGFRLSAQASQLNGPGFESWLHHLLTVGPCLRPQSLGFLIYKGTVSKIKWDHSAATT